MDVLSFSTGFDDEESGVAERAEATLRSRYSQAHSSSSAVASRAGAAASSSAIGDAQPRKRGRPLGSRNRPRVEGAESASKRRRPVAASRSAEHSEFAPPPPEAHKGAYRLDASAPSEELVDRSLGALGIDDPAERSAVGALVASAAHELRRADDGDASASFARQHAVAPEVMYDADSCPICEETMTFTYHAARARVGVGGHRAANRLLSNQQRQRERLTRALQARSNLADSDQKCHQVLYNIEHALRGRWADRRIFRLMLVLRREWIEKNLERFEIPYVPWTMAMLQTHYNPTNGHFAQPIRQVALEYDRSLDLHEKTYRASCQDGTLDYRAIAAFKDLCKTTQTYREEMARLLDEGEPDIAEALRTLAAAIARTTHDEGALRLQQDPEAAAGRLPAGGDNRTSASIGSAHEPHSAYALSHLSAQ